jgi:hypothetical protein
MGMLYRNERAPWVILASRPYIDCDPTRSEKTSNLVWAVPRGTYYSCAPYVLHHDNPSDPWVKIARDNDRLFSNSTRTTLWSRVPCRFSLARLKKASSQLHFPADHGRDDVETNDERKTSNKSASCEGRCSLCSACRRRGGEKIARSPFHQPVALVRLLCRFFPINNKCR